MAGERSYFSKESVVTGHHVYKHMDTRNRRRGFSRERTRQSPWQFRCFCVDQHWIREQLLPWSFPPRTWPLSVKSYDAFLFDITNTRTYSHASVQAGSRSSDTPPAIIREPEFITVQDLWPPALKRDPASKRHGGYSRQYGTYIHAHAIHLPLGSLHWEVTLFSLLSAYVIVSTHQALRYNVHTFYSGQSLLILWKHNSNCSSH